MSMILVRPHILNGGEIWFQRPRLFPSLLCMKVGYDWYMYDTPKYLIHDRLNKLAKEAEKLLAALSIIERDLKEEKKHIEKCVGQSRNVGDWDFIDTDEIGKNPVTGEDLIPAWGSPQKVTKPDQTWQKVFQRRLYAHPSQKGVAGRQRHIEGEEGGRSVYLSETLGQFKDLVEESTGADTIIPYRHKDTGKNSKGKKNNHGKNRKKGESNEEYESRMEDLRNGNADDHDDEPLNW